MTSGGRDRRESLASASEGAYSTNVVKIHILVRTAPIGSPFIRADSVRREDFEPGHPNGRARSFTLSCLPAAEWFYGEIEALGGGSGVKHLVVVEARDRGPSLGGWLETVSLSFLQ